MAEITVAQVYAIKDKEKVPTLEEASKEAAEVVATATLSDEQTRLYTYVYNGTPKTVRKIDIHFWNGWPATNYPDLPPWHYILPWQNGDLPQGIKFGLAYTDGQDSEDTTGRKWIVAYDTAAKKAYAEAGPNGPIDWDVIEVKLGLSGNKSDYTDQVLGGRTIAEIDADGLNAIANFL